MNTVHSVREMQARAADARRRNRRTGLVPTMGYLHEGHLSLVRLAREHGDRVVVSIFVNPAQFGPAEDLDRYPRDLERDLALCREEGVDTVFAPSAEAMYAPDASVWVEETALSRGLCGAGRPGHFRGVATVVAKLFHIVQPDVAVFGRKDYQQARVIERMVRDLNWPVRILLGPIVREADGLAMSSRNAYLSAEERVRARRLYVALREAERLAGAGTREAAALRTRMREVLEAGGGVDVEYAEVVDARTLEPVERVAGPAVALVAARVGATRLIDNVELGG
ncbi:MAG: pantoate--beta-alanine ligase [Lentisphaerae bacterium]|nr:pantoate--beta-alanine ligase [Lentisphaerota bacterium]